jgi:dephospho-CoA kinase
MLVVGLTGGIGSGKTAVSNRLKQLGITIVDADVVSRQVVEPGKPALKTIRNYFGPSIILSDGNLNRAAMRQRVFANRSEKEWLEELLHPLIGAEIDRQIKAATSPYVVLVSPLLLETNQRNRCDRILVVDVPVEVQIERASSRDNNDPHLIRSIVVTQMSREKRLESADDIINNEGDLESLYHQVDTLHDLYIDLANG